MGLDAHVFKGKAAISRDFPEIAFKFVVETGEPYPVDETINLALKVLCAADYRIGHSSWVYALRRSVEELLPPDSVTIARVLWSGIHAGDHIPGELLPQFARELVALDASPDPRVQGVREKNEGSMWRSPGAEGTTICF